MDANREVRAERGQAGRGSGERGPAVELVAYQGSRQRHRLDPAPRRREWMDATVDRWANRCLPLLIANESGWVLLNPLTFRAVWSGDPHPRGVTIEYLDEGVPTPAPVENYFGYGTLTWAVPYLFRTPPGWNLLVRGPANWPRDGLCALEGLVETDWSPMSFTMNWKFTRPDHEIVFPAGEPYCMVVPQRRGDLEAFRPAVRELRSDPEIHAAAKNWGERRHEASVEKFLADYARDFAHAKDAWQGDYFRGIGPDGTPVSEHQKTRRLLPFAGQDE